MIDPIALQLGPFSIRWYALCIVSGLVLAVYLSMREAPRKNIRPDDILDFILIAFPLAIVGARIYYVAFEWKKYVNNPTEIIAIWNGGIAIYGGLITGAIVLYFYSQRKFINTLDFPCATYWALSSFSSCVVVPTSANGEKSQPFILFGMALDG